LLFIACCLGGGCWYFAIPHLRAADLSDGLSLADPAVGTPSAIGALLAFGLPMIVGAILVSCSGSVLSGPFVLGVGLTVVSGFGGSIDGTLRRYDEAGALATLYPALALEVVGWGCALLVLLVLIHRVRKPLREKLPGPLVSGQVHKRWRSNLRMPDGSALLAGLVSCAAGGLMSGILLRSATGPQVIGALLLSFTVAGMLGRTLVNRPRVIVILLSPCIVGLVGYLWLWRTTPDAAQIMPRYFTDKLMPLGLALPIHYASAGVMGAAIGIGLGQGLLMGSHAAREVQDAGNPHQPHDPD